MKKQFLLPFIFIALLFSGCQEPDEDVDMPMPENTLDEKILGEWQLYESSVTSDVGDVEPFIDIDTTK